MIGWPLKSTFSSIGCALNHRMVKLAQFTCARRGRAQLYVEAVSLPDSGNDAWPGAATAALKQALATRTFTGRRVITCLQAEQLQLRSLRLAVIPDDELQSAAHWRIAKELECEVNSLRSGFYEVGEMMTGGKRRREVIAVAASRQDLEAHVKVLLAANMSPVAVDTHCGALARCFRREDAPQETPSTCFIIEVGHNRSTLMVVEDGNPRFIRCVEMGQRHIIERTAERLQAGPDQYERIEKQLHDDDLSSNTADSDIAHALHAVCTLFAAELAHQVSLCVHYLNEGRLASSRVLQGCFIGAGRQRDAMIATINRSSRIEFHPAREMLSTQMQIATSNLPPEMSLDDWLLPVGLALYEHEHVVQGAAA